MVSTHPPPMYTFSHLCLFFLANKCSIFVECFSTERTCLCVRVCNFRKIELFFFFTRGDIQLKNTIKVCILMRRYIKTPIGKAHTLTGEKSVSPSVSLCLHEYASVVKNCFKFKSG